MGGQFINISARRTTLGLPGTSTARGPRRHRRETNFSAQTCSLHSVLRVELMSLVTCFFFSFFFIQNTRWQKLLKCVNNRYTNRSGGKRRASSLLNDFDGMLMPRVSLRRRGGPKGSWIVLICPKARQDVGIPIGYCRRSKVALDGAFWCDFIEGSTRGNLPHKSNTVRWLLSDL